MNYFIHRKETAMSLFFNTISRLVITFLPRRKCLLISWLQSPSAVILEPLKIKCVTVSNVSPSICHEVIGPDAMILVLSQLFHSPLSFSSKVSQFFTFCHKEKEQIEGKVRIEAIRKLYSNAGLDLDRTVGLRRNDQIWNIYDSLCVGYMQGVLA